jgi:hypothetical protein
MRIHTAIISIIDEKPETALLREGCFARREWSCRSQWRRCFAEEGELGGPCSGGEDYRKGIQRAFKDLNDISDNVADFQGLLSRS